MKINRYVIKENPTISNGITKIYYWNGSKKVWWNLEEATWYYTPEDAQEDINANKFVDCKVVRITVNIKKKK